MMSADTEAKDAHTGSGHAQSRAQIFFGKFIASCALGVAVGTGLYFIAGSLADATGGTMAFDLPFGPHHGNAILTIAAVSAAIWNVWRT